MLGCSYCDHYVWSTDAWVKHVHTYHPELPIFIEMKLESVTPAESAEVLRHLLPPKVCQLKVFKSEKYFTYLHVVSQYSESIHLIRM